jgi:hypothetical protein
MAYVDWIKIEHTTPRKEEVIRIAGILKINPYEVVGRLIELWIWADQNTKTGRTFVQDMSAIDHLTGKEGFGQAMLTAGWLTVVDDGFEFPNFMRHNGKSAKKRADDARSKKSSREINRTKFGQMSEDEHDVTTQSSSSTSTSSNSSNVEERKIGEKPNTIEQMAADLASEFVFQYRGKKPFVEEVRIDLQEKLRVYGKHHFDFIMQKIKGERDKTFPLFKFWLSLKIEEQQAVKPFIPTKSAEQIRFDERIAKEKANA